MEKDKVLYSEAWDVQVKDSDEWRSVGTILTNDLQLGKDVGFKPNDELTRNLQNKVGSPIRLIALCFKNDEVLHYEIREMRQWNFHKGNVLALSPNTSYSEYQLKSLD